MRLHPLRSFAHIRDPSGVGTEFIEEGLLNPDFGSRMDADAAAAQAMNLKFSGGQAQRIDASVRQSVSRAATPRLEQDIQQLVALTGSPRETAAAALQTHGNVEAAWLALDSGSPAEGVPPQPQPPPPDAPANAPAVSALVAAFGVTGAVANDVLQAVGGDSQMAAEILSRHPSANGAPADALGAAPAPPAAPAPAPDPADAKVRNQ